MRVLSCANEDFELVDGGKRQVDVKLVEFGVVGWRRYLSDWTKGSYADIEQYVQ